MKKNKIDNFSLRVGDRGIAKMSVSFAAVIVSLFLASCASIQESPKYQFSEGVYTAKLNGERRGSVYVNIEEDSLIVVPVVSQKDNVLLDTTKSSILSIAEEVRSSPRRPYTFSKPSFDLDVLTIPFKYRPSTKGFPRQLNTAFQGALYLGLRKDKFRISYKKTPLGNYKRSFNHFGYSAGFFTGLGASTVNEFVTRNQVAYEYEGVVFLNGFAAIVSINNYTVGLTVGIDKLLDRNHHNWIYHNKPWIGLAFGLNLN
ncbi:hypothetical protein [Pontibacter harenae]|uniref:hypothetical protein n=1 Tax=Pontibacter harenae TaxID=2894083 RepID=UPI001E44E187|nr:hypothetical protein [Pontibacter harenae]MCC9167382.1 hypothetical protein [Pontibacter harenae]